MRNQTGFSRSGRALGLVAAASLAAAVSSLPAGIGNLGRTTTDSTGGGSSTTASYNPSYTIFFGAGQPVSAARNSLVSAINSDPNFNTLFVAASVVDPGDPNSNSFSVTKVGGADVDHLSLCETDPNVQNLGVSISGGRTVASLNKVTAINNDGSIIVTITTKDHAVTSRTITTGCTVSLTCPAANGVNAQIIAAFQLAGFVAQEEGSNLTFRLPGDLITAIRVTATDTAMVTLCVDVSSPASVPATGPAAMFILVLLLTGSAIWMLRKDTKARLTRP